MLYDTIVCINKYRVKGVKGTLSVEAICCFHFPSLLNWDQLLTHFILNDLFWHIYWKSPFSISGVLGYVSQDIFVVKWLNN